MFNFKTFVLILYFNPLVFLQIVDECPQVPTGCQCSHKKKGYKIACVLLSSVSLHNLPNNVTLDIDLSSNMLKALNSSMFPNPNLIKRLSLSNNDIETIEDNTFAGFNALKKLDLSKNLLVELKENTFSGLETTTLNTLDLKENRILSIDKLALNGLAVDKLLLSKQLKSRNERADLLAFNDFVSSSLVKSLDLDDNQILCDCNIEWLARWSLETQSGTLTDNTKCHYPSPLKGVQIKDLIPIWGADGCNKFDASFSLPFFKLYPTSNQIMFENDQVYLLCQSTWTSASFVVWNINGVDLKQQSLPPNVTVQHHTNLHVGVYISTLIIHKLQSNYSTITCNLNVYGSGSLSATLKIHTLTEKAKTCSPKIEKTDQGVLSWPTTINGALAQTSCPYGGIRSRQAYLQCQNGTWESSNVKNCFFSSNITRSLQDFYEIAATRKIDQIKTMASAFSVFFSKNFKKISSRYDLYFIYQILYEIMQAYKDRKGVEYSGFFWSSIGIIVKKHIYLPTMQQVLYKKTANWRFQSLLELHISQEFKKLNSKYVINNHKEMATYSLAQQTGSLLNCYIVPPSAIKNGNLSVNCLHYQNDTLNKMSNVMLQLISERKVIHINFLVFASYTFFQLSRESKYKVVSPVVGLNIGEVNNNSTNYNSTPETLLTFKTIKEYPRPKLMYWSYANSSAGNWNEVKNCKMLKTITDGKPNITQYQCFIKWKRNLTYLALLAEKEPAIVYAAKYLEIVVYVGAGISCTFLIMTFVIYSLARSLRFNRGETSILLNLCIALILAEIIFGLGIHRTDYPFLCQTISIALHFLFLAALLWLGCGAVLLIVLVKKKDSIKIKEHDPILKYYLVAWGIPIIVCAITVAFDPNNYWSTDYCWMRPGPSLGAFVGPGGLILLTDFILLCYLHALTNRIYPDLIDDYVDGESPPPPSTTDKNQCNNKICKYKVKPESIYEKTFPKKDDLLFYIRGSLSALLWLCSMFTLLVMMYTYQKKTTAVYLYYAFAYGTALCNILIGATLFLYHCYKKEELKPYFEIMPFCCFPKRKDGMLEEQLLKSDEGNENEDAPPHSPSIVVRSSSHNEDGPYLHLPPVDISGNSLPPAVEVDERSEYLQSTSGVFGVNDQVVQSTEGSTIFPSVRVETCPTFKGRGESLDNLSDHALSDVSQPLHQQPIDSDCNANLTNHTVSDTNKPYQSQTDASEQDRQSVGGKENSIGDCSLTSSRNNRRVRPTNPDIPDSIRSFVPENWRPAQRRRRPKKGSYYPYFMTELTPKTASVAFSSNASSVTSTTVGGVPLFINKKQAANNLAMYSELFNPNKNNAPQMNRLGPIRQPPLNQNYPVNTPVQLPPAPNPFHQYPLSSGPVSPSMSGVQIGMLPSHAYVDYRGGTPGGYATSEGSVTNQSADGNYVMEKHEEDECSRISEVEEETEPLPVEESDSSIEIEPLKVAPILYIPIPHLTLKQFTIRSETSV